MLADIVERPAFAPAEIDRIRAQSLDRPGAGDEGSAAGRAAGSAGGAIFGAAHPYGAPPGGDPAAIAKFTRDDLVAFHHRWLRPDNAKIFVVSSLPLSEVKAELETRVRQLGRVGGAQRREGFPRSARASGEPEDPARRPPRRAAVDDPRRTVVADRPVQRRRRHSTSPTRRLAGNSCRGSTWTCARPGAGPTASAAIADDAAARCHYTVSAPVQADRTADALAALTGDVGDFLATKGVTPNELERAVTNSVNALPGQFETSEALLSGMMRSDLMRRPEDYYVRLPARYRALTTAEADHAARAAIDPKGFTWVVVGDAAKLKPQLDKLGMPVEIVAAK